MPKTASIEDYGSTVRSCKSTQVPFNCTDGWHTYYCHQLLAHRSGTASGPKQTNSLYTIQFLSSITQINHWTTTTTQVHELCASTCSCLMWIQCQSMTTICTEATKIPFSVKGIWQFCLGQISSLMFNKNPVGNCNVVKRPIFIFTSVCYRLKYTFQSICHMLLQHYR